MSESLIAVIGLAGRFPGARDIEEFWSNLAAGVESISVLPPEAGAKKGRPYGVLEGAEWFDADFFGFSPLEALTLDPQHRLVLECSVEALERAGCDPRTYEGAIGVYAGASQTEYLETLRANRAGLSSLSDYQLRLATGLDFLTTRVTYKLNLHGPGVTVQTACSTSLVAIHVAAQALLAGECDIALAGGVSARVPPPVLEAQEGMFAPDGHCRVFDAAASGTVPANAVALVVLKRLDEALVDGDQVLAVLRGSAVNNDGSGKVGYTAPSIEGQARAIRTAQAIAGTPPDTIGYVEAHGTGTPLGDPIEVAALTRAFRAGAPSRVPCFIGSVKTNIGHTDAAAGVVGFVKAVLALERGLIPPSLNFTEPNPECAFAESPFAVVTELRTWPSRPHPRRAGVSSFGIGGTNAHVVLEEAPELPPSGPARPFQLLPLSARTPAALEAVTDRLALHLAGDGDAKLADVAWTLQVGRTAHAHRRFHVTASTGAAAAALRDREVHTGTGLGSHTVAFVFTGQGGQHVGMARDLYEHEPRFRERLDECCEVARPHLGFDLRDLLYPARDDRAAAERLATTRFAQPAVFSVEYALAHLWMHWGVEPVAVAGHSLGAYAAACLTGVIALPDAIRLVIERGRLLERTPSGGMLAVPLPEAEVSPLLDGELSVAAVNSPSQSVVSGPPNAIQALHARLEAAGIESRVLRIMTGGHSALVDPILHEFRARVAETPLHGPRIPWVSDTSGQWTTAEQASSPDHWVRHLRQAVRFTDVLATLLAEPNRLLLEVGPGRALTTTARRHPAFGSTHLAVPSLPHAMDGTSALASTLGAAGQLWLAGIRLDWGRMHEGETRRRLALPTYPFQRRRYAPDQAAEAGRRSISLAIPGTPVETGGDEPGVRFPPPDTGTRYREPTSGVEREVAHQVARVLGVQRTGLDDNFFALGGDSLIAARLVSQLRSGLEVQLRVRDVFEAPTVGALAALLTSRMPESAGPLRQPTKGEVDD